MTSWHMTRVALLLVALVGVSTESATLLNRNRASAEILWDTWGIPHIFAETLEVALYAYGYAHSHLHGNLLLERIGIDRGRASEYWGETWLESDIRTWADELPVVSDELYRVMDPESVQKCEAFAAGFNYYVYSFREEFEVEKLLVMPLTGVDIWRHYNGYYWAASLSRSKNFNAADYAPKSGRDVFRKRETATVHFSAYVDYSPPDGIPCDYDGSNCVAINGRMTDDGQAKLVMNPHLPYSNATHWIEAHIVVESENINLHGGTLIGFPFQRTAFNEDLGWTFTVNIVQNFINYRISLVDDNNYEYDNQILPIERVAHTFRVLQSNGTYVEHQVVVEKTIQGPIFSRANGVALATRWAGQDRPDAIKQFWDMGKSRSVAEFNEAMSQQQMGFYTLFTATRDGDISIVSNGWIPRRNPDLGDYEFWAQPVDGTTSGTMFDDIHSFSEQIIATNPATGWLQNSNEPPWTFTFPISDPDLYPSYFTERPRMGYRPQCTTRMLVESPGNITFDELVVLKHNTRHEMPIHVMPELLAAIDRFGNTDEIKEAAFILQNWNQHLENESPGAILFLRWMDFNPNAEEFYVNQWSSSDPLGTPNTIRDPERAVVDLQRAIDSLESEGVPLDIFYGDYYRLPDPDDPTGTIPANGGVDTYRNTRFRGRGNTAYHGDSWVCIIEFGPGRSVRAKSLIGYGNASQGPHVNEQWRLYSNKELKDVWRERDEIIANLERFDNVEYP